MPYSDEEFEALSQSVKDLASQVATQQQTINNLAKTVEYQGLEITNYRRFFNQLYYLGNIVTEYINATLSGQQSPLLSKLKTRLNLWQQQT